MIYLSLDTNKVKLLLLKKTLLGQYDVSFFNKRHEIELLQDGQVANIDLLASAIKESLTQANTTPIKEKEVCLILPPKAFQFLRITIPRDIAVTAINSFIKDKIRTTLPKDIDNYLHSYITKENNNQYEVLFFAIEKEIIKKYHDCLTLLDLKLNSVLPITLLYFKLFEKTLRDEKREKIFYVHYDKIISGYFFDSLGPIPQEAWVKNINSTEEFEDLLKQKIQEFESSGIKLNRIILSGLESDKIRQDTFTKSVGVWTNLLKRIITDFYQEYLKMVIVQKNIPLPFLELDECFGAFVFNQEEKNFSLFKNNSLIKKGSLPKLKLPFKEIGIFVISFILSFVALYLLSQNKTKILKTPIIGTKTKVANTPSPNPPTPTPTSAKEKLKIKVLNGSGTPGKAASVVEIMKNKGYPETINGGNAGNFDYEVTEIKTKKSFNPQVNVIKSDLKDYTTSFKSGELDEKENADVIITIGKDFK